MSTLVKKCSYYDQNINESERNVLVEAFEADDVGRTEELIEKEGIRNALVTAGYSDFQDNHFSIAFLISNDIESTLAERVRSDWWQKTSGKKIFFWIPVDGYIGHQTSSNFLSDKSSELREYFSYMNSLNLNNFYDKSVSNLFNNLDADSAPDEWKTILKKHYLEERLIQQKLL